MLPAQDQGVAAGFLALLRFRALDVAELMARLREAVALLATFDGFVDARVGRAIDDGGLVSLAVTWRDVGSYRRALSAYEVKVAVVPLLSTALDEPTAYELLHVYDATGGRDSVGALAADAGTVSLGGASAQVVPPAPS